MDFVRAFHYWVAVGDERDNNNNVSRYELALPYSFQFSNGFDIGRRVYRKADLKKEILNGNIKVDNLQITSDGKLTYSAIQNTQIYADCMQNIKALFEVLKEYAEEQGLKIKGQIVKRPDSEIRETGIVAMMDIMVKNSETGKICKYTISVDFLHSWYFSYKDENTGDWEFYSEMACCKSVIKSIRIKIYSDLCCNY